MCGITGIFRKGNGDQSPIEGCVARISSTLAHRGMSVTVIRYAERPELREGSEALSRAVWPEYNQHGEVLDRYWGRLLEDFPEFQFVLYHDQDGVLAEGHTVVWARVSASATRS